MVIRKRIIANQSNAQRSTGPKTTEGKRASSKNALKHGILSGEIVAKGEDEEAFDTLRGGLFDELKPETALEAMLVERLILLAWRERRLCQAERTVIEAAPTPRHLSLYDLEIAQNFPPKKLSDTILEKNNLIPITDQLLFGRYQVMLTNQFRLTLSELRKEQELRMKTIDSSEMNDTYGY